MPLNKRLSLNAIFFDQTIPLILEGRDVVAMAKTGSGKTACFLIPLFEKLKSRNASVGARALILSPTRELAIQTFKFFKDLGKFMDLKVALVLGGDPMSSQFSAIHTSPDVIVATPGRFLHLCVEMDLKLNSIGKELGQVSLSETNLIFFWIYPQSTWFSMRLIDYSKWVSVNNWTKHYIVCLTPSKWLCFRPHYRNCWLTSPELVSAIQFWFV